MFQNNSSFKKKVESDVLYKSLIGKEIEIADSSNKNLVGIKGILVYESSNMFYIDVFDEVKKVLKKEVVISFNYDSRCLVVDGKALCGSLVSRIKKMK